MKHRGQAAEQIACCYLTARGLTFESANVRFAVGEIDLVMREQNTWVFVEVKYRRDDSYGGALEALRPQQAYRLQRAAEAYLQRHQLNVDARIDLVAIQGEQVNWIKNILAG
ncbi:YraN family protein [Paraferrimonas sedimenticola]|uniref:UPF0102 protein GCM10007895_28200 n=1 Tax=Paraferrimonas sedimenticola TaxID=375674 RepID=A0AA37W2C6_9GAMM|nr:YraN family protein [Paraferrimonas sedimenticola]GLP97513.1 UPF0102 protein [Paraferrimonas sedimenticola]